MKMSLRLLILIISIITVISGVMQWLDPTFVLKSIGVISTPVSRQLFATIALFMILFGGMVIHSIYSAHESSIVILWAAFQKLGASVAVAMAILHGLFNLLSGAVALFDFCSAILFLYYYRHLSAHEND